MVAALTMVLGMSGLTAFAAGTGSITVTNPVKGEVYNAYKVFDAVPAEDYDTTHGETTASDNRKIAYTYDGSNATFLAALQEQDSPFEATKIATTDSTYRITLKNGKNASDVETFLKAQQSNLGTAVGGSPITATGSTVVFSNLAYGYYYVTTTTGSAVTIDSAAKDVKVVEKNTVPSVDKKQNTTASNYKDDKLDVNIGDTVYYETTVTAGKKNDKDITLTDTMSAGLTLNAGSIVVKNGDTTLTADNQYTVSTTPAEGENYTFKIVLKDSYVKTLNEGDKVVVTYNATVNKNAAIDQTTNDKMDKNTVEMTYSNQTTTDTVYISTYDAKITKHKETKDGDFLPGAGFRLYDAQTGGNEIKFAKDTTGYYVVKDGQGVEITVDSADGANIRGLAPGTYYLEETTTPDGYNTLTARQPITITSGQTTPVDNQVINNQGSALPSTGGIGTTIFYILGAILVLGAGVVLVTRRRLSK